MIDLPSAGWYVAAEENAYIRYWTGEH